MRITHFLAVVSLVALSVACEQVVDPDPPEGPGTPGEVEAPTSPTLAVDSTAIKTLSFSWADVANETEYRLLEDPDGESGLSVVATLPAGSDSHDLLVFLPAKVNAQYSLQACNSGGCASSAQVAVGPGLVDAIGYFKASNAAAGDTFGSAVAISADGTTLAVGAHQESSAATGVNGEPTTDTLASSGAVYVFTLDAAGAWSQQAYIKAWNTGALDRFGEAIALSADGSTLAVGAYAEDSSGTGIDSHLGGFVFADSASGSGAVYIFTRDEAAGWSQEAYVKAPDTNADDLFGYSVALSADGSDLAVGAPFEDSGAEGIGGGFDELNGLNSGAVYLLGRANGTWSYRAYVKASSNGENDLFGSDVAIAEDGRTLAVGAIREDGGTAGVGGDQDDNTVQDAGAAYVFVRSGGGIWSQQAYVKASNPGITDFFGNSLDLSANGATLVVGVFSEGSASTGVDGDQGDESAADAGAVYVFDRAAAGSWLQTAYLKASNTGVRDEFGWDVSLSGDGDTIAVGARREDSSATGVSGDESDENAGNSGAVYLFARAADTWLASTYVKASNTGAADNFGRAVALSSDGRTLAVGATGESSGSIGIGGDQNDGSASISGAVYLY